MRRDFLLLSAFIGLCSPLYEARGQAPCGPNATCVDSAPAACHFDNETIYRIEGCRASVIASWQGFSNPVRENDCIANPPQGYMLVDHREVPGGRMGNGWFKVDKYTKGLDYHYEQAIDDAYREAFELAGKIADKKKSSELQAKIKQQWDFHRQIVQNIKTNADTVHVRVWAQGDGAAYDRKRSYMEMGATLMVRCVAPVNLADQIKEKYGLIVEKGALPKQITFINDSGKTLYVNSVAADLFTDCKDANYSNSITPIRGGRDAEVVIDPELDLCYFFSERMTAFPRSKIACRASAGDSVTYSAAARNCKE